MSRNYSLCLFPGSFDPITLGHVDIIERAAAMFEKVVVCVLINQGKSGLFSQEERINLIEKAVCRFPNVTVAFHSGGLLEYADVINAGVILRGLRNERDFAYERDWEAINREQSPEIRFLYMMSRKEYASVSSSYVKEIAGLGYDISKHVPREIIGDIKRKTEIGRAKT